MTFSTAKIFAAGKSLGGLAILFAATVLEAQTTVSTSCPANQRLEAKAGFESFDCDGCKLRRDPETGVAYVEFAKAPVLRGIGTTGALRDGDLLTHIDGLSILTPAGAKALATIPGGKEVRFTVQRNNAPVQVALSPEHVCRADPSARARFNLSYRNSITGDTVFVRNDSAWTRSLAKGTFNFHNGWSGFDSAATSFHLGTLHFVRADTLMYKPLSFVWSRSDSSVWQPTFTRGYIGDLRARDAVSPRGWFGFSLGCDSCSFGSPGVTTAVQRTAAVWTFSAPPKIVSVDSAGPADRAGLRVGDVIVSVDGLPIQSPNGGARFSAAKPGDTVVVRYTRGGATRSARLILTERLTSREAIIESRPDLLLRWPGSSPSGSAEVDITGTNITVTEDPRTGERTITGTNMKIVVRPPRTPGF